MKELVICLKNHRNIHIGKGHRHVWGGYVRVVDVDGRELGYWDKEEWKDDPECVMGAIFALAQNGRIP